MLLCNLFPVLHQLLKTFGSCLRSGVLPWKCGSENDREQEAVGKKRADFHS